MTLEELKAAMEAAKAELDKKSDDSELKTKYEAAKKAYDDAKAAAEADEGDDESKWDDKTKAYIVKLRKEAADSRTKAKDAKSHAVKLEEQKKAILKAAGIESEDENPEEKLKSSQAEANNLMLRTAVLETAIQHGIGQDHVDYFQFLMTQELNALKDDEELSDEQIAAVVAKVKKVGGGKAGNTSVGKGKDGSAPPPGEDNGVTLDQFAGMTTTERSKLYLKSPEKYSQLLTEAKQKRRLL